MKTKNNLEPRNPGNGQVGAVDLNSPGSNGRRVSRRVRMLVRRHLRLVAKGKSCFDQASKALALAINNGLEVGEPIEMDIIGADGQPRKEQFCLVDNFDQDVVYKPARVPHYEFKRIPRSRREKTDPSPAQESA